MGGRDGGRRPGRGGGRGGRGRAGGRAEPGGGRGGAQGDAGPAAAVRDLSRAKKALEKRAEQAARDLSKKAFAGCAKVRHALKKARDFEAGKLARRLKQALAGGATADPAAVERRRSALELCRGLEVDHLVVGALRAHGLERVVDDNIRGRYADGEGGVEGGLMQRLVGHKGVVDECRLMEQKLRDVRERAEEAAGRVRRIQRAIARQERRATRAANGAAAGGETDSGSGSQGSDSSSEGGRAGGAALSGTSSSEDEDEGGHNERALASGSGSSTTSGSEPGSEDDEPGPAAQALLDKLRAARAAARSEDEDSGSEGGGVLESESDDSGVMQWDDIDALEREEGLAAAAAAAPAEGGGADSGAEESQSGASDAPTSEGESSESDGDEGGVKVRRAQDTTGLLQAASLRAGVKQGKLSKGDAERRMRKRLAEAADAASKDAPPKKKARMGQRQRRLLAQRKYGADAKHIRAKLEERKRSAAEDARADRAARHALRGGAEDAGAGRPERTRRARADAPADAAPAGRGSGAQVAERKKKETEGGGSELHPSWAARQRLKAQEAKLPAPAGKKVVFDDD